MIVCIAGSRGINDYDALVKAIDGARFRINLILTGGAKGVDQLATRYARHTRTQYAVFPPMWDELGKKAGFVRSDHMIQVADGLIALWDGHSRGTLGTIRFAVKRNCHIFVADEHGDMMWRRSDDGTEEENRPVPWVLG